ncbi:MAG: hypothetical protein JW787_07520 [Sedimentisphaerales bacterium]|nr:hypothetical protein [Sedimentisphaerales bacterium]
MSKNVQLTKKQFSVIDDIFESELKESEILRKHKVSRATYNKWLDNEYFTREFSTRIASEQRRNTIHITQNVSKAVGHLENIAQKQDGETSRKACLDIIEIEKQESDKQRPSQMEYRPAESTACLSNEAAGRILAALAEEK